MRAGFFLRCSRGLVLALIFLVEKFFRWRGTLRVLVISGAGTARGVQHWPAVLIPESGNTAVALLRSQSFLRFLRYPRKLCIARVTQRFPQFSTAQYPPVILDMVYYSDTVSVLSSLSPQETLVTRYRPQPPWEFLLTASRNSLQSYELTRLSHAANLRKEIGTLMDQWLEENSSAAVARWLIDQREHSARASETSSATAEKVANDAAASDNFFPDSILGPPMNREAV